MIKFNVRDGKTYVDKNCRKEFHEVLNDSNSLYNQMTAFPRVLNFIKTGVYRERLSYFLEDSNTVSTIIPEFERTPDIKVTYGNVSGETCMMFIWKNVTEHISTAYVSYISSEKVAQKYLEAFPNATDRELTIIKGINWVTLTKLTIEDGDLMFMFREDCDNYFAEDEEINESDDELDEEVDSDEKTDTYYEKCDKASQKFEDEFDLTKALDEVKNLINSWNIVDDKDAEAMRDAVNALISVTCQTFANSSNTLSAKAQEQIKKLEDTAWAALGDAVRKSAVDIATTEFPKVIYKEYEKAKNIYSSIFDSVSKKFNKDKK